MPGSRLGREGKEKQPGGAATAERDESERNVHEISKTAATQRDDSGEGKTRNATKREDAFDVSIEKNQSTAYSQRQWGRCSKKKPPRVIIMAISEKKKRGGQNMIRHLGQKRNQNLLSIPKQGRDQRKRKKETWA